MRLGNGWARGNLNVISRGVCLSVASCRGNPEKRSPSSPCSIPASRRIGFQWSFCATNRLLVWMLTAVAEPRPCLRISSRVLLSVHSFEEDFPGAVRCALTETHRLPVHLLRSSTGLMRAGGLVPLLNNRMKTRQNTGELMGPIS